MVLFERRHFYENINGKFDNRTGTAGPEDYAGGKSSIQGRHDDSLLQVRYQII